MSNFKLSKNLKKKINNITKTPNSEFEFQQYLLNMIAENESEVREMNMKLKKLKKKVKNLKKQINILTNSENSFYSENSEPKTEFEEEWEKFKKAVHYDSQI